MPKISVVMPVFNAEAYVGSAIDSILQQTHQDFELIVVNDGSTDGSESIITTYTDERIVLLSNPVNSGLVYSLNFGITQARGEFIARMDADDIALPDRLKVQLAFLQSNKDYGLCGTFYQVIDTQGNLLNRVELPQTDRDLRTYLQFGNCFCHSTIMFRASLFKKYRYEESYFLAEDYKLWYSFSGMSKIAILPEYTLRYRVHNNNISTRKRAQMLGVLLRMNALILSDLGIGFTEKELAMHTHFLAFDHLFFSNQQHVSELESWLLRIYPRLKMDERFNHRLIIRILLRRWFVICFKTKNYRKLLFSPLLLRFKIKYVRHLTEKVTDFYFRKNLGIDY